MFGFIEKLRQKSDRAKKYIAFLIALLLAGIIFIVWLSVIFPNWRSDQKKGQAATPEPSPFSSLGTMFTSGISSIGDEVGKMKDLISSTSTSAEPGGTTTVQE